MSATGSLFRHVRLRPTNRARVVLLLVPVVLPINVIWWFCMALGKAARSFAAELNAQAGYTLRFWYREVYRPARYGSIWDDVDEGGHPKAWGTRRGSGAA